MSENPTAQSSITQRPRRLRRAETLRRMVRETNLTVDDLIIPMFVMEGEEEKVEIASMPGCYRFTLDLLLREIAEVYDLAQNRWVDEKKVILETLLSIKRAGADLILTYFAKEVALMLHK